MARQEIDFCEGSPQDASAFLDFMGEVAVETDYLVMDETGLAISIEEMEAILAASLDSPVDLILLAWAGQKVIAALTVKTSTQYRLSHIGDVFIAVRKPYWRQGIGKILMEELLVWAEENQLLQRLELSVQVRNVAAIHLYQTFAFEIEGMKKRGARTDQGDYLDVYLMGRLLGDK